MIKDIDGLIDEVCELIREQTDEAVIGLSGGADSTLVACLCVEALGKENVYGLHMPFNELDLDTFNSKSQVLAKHLGINDKIVYIGDAVEDLSVEFGNLSRLNQGNMRSRMRMIALYSHCCELGEATGKRCRVMGTGNLSEDLIGYDTKGGDALCDFFPIGSLLKSEVYQLLDHFATEGMIDESMINKVPSAGLWNGQTDEDELGYSYDEMEPFVLMGLREEWDLDNPIGKLVHDMHFANKHKHEAPPVFELRKYI